MSRILNPGYTEDHVQRLFFPNGKAQAQEQALEDDMPVASAVEEAARRPGFLSDVSRQMYERICWHIIENLSLRFPNIHHFLSVKKEETHIMAQVLAYVVGWLNPELTDVVWQQESTKPLLCEDIVLILEDYASTSILNTGSDD